MFCHILCLLGSRRGFSIFKQPNHRTGCCVGSTCWRDELPSSDLHDPRVSRQLFLSRHGGRGAGGAEASPPHGRNKGLKVGRPHSLVSYCKFTWFTKKDHAIQKNKIQHQSIKPPSPCCRLLAAHESSRPHPIPEGPCRHHCREALFKRDLVGSRFRLVMEHQKTRRCAPLCPLPTHDPRHLSVHSNKRGQEGLAKSNSAKRWTPVVRVARRCTVETLAR